MAIQYKLQRGIYGLYITPSTSVGSGHITESIQCNTELNVTRDMMNVTRDTMNVTRDTMNVTL